MIRNKAMIDGPVIFSADTFYWQDWTPDEITSEIVSSNPLWVRITNFHRKDLQLLAALPRGSHVLWKMEFSGYGSDSPPVEKSAGLDVDRHVAEILSLPHRVTIYTYLNWAVEGLRRLAPRLERETIHTVPIALNAQIGLRDRTTARQRLGIPQSALVYGVAGNVSYRGRRMAEVVRAFLDSSQVDQRMLCGLVPPGSTAVLAKQTGREIADLRETAGSTGGYLEPTSEPRLYARSGDYGDWPWMTDFYSAIDVMLVNSDSDSWGRAVSEPASLGIPVLALRSDCATNHLCPALTLVDDFADFSSPEFAAAIASAQSNAAGIKQYFCSEYSVGKAMDAFREMAVRSLPAATYRRLMELLESASSRQALARALAY